MNEQAGIKPVKVSDDVYTLVKRAYEYSQDSQGGVRYGNWCDHSIMANRF